MAFARIAAASESFSVRITPRDIWPPAPVTDLAGAPGSEGQALLQWTAPDEDQALSPTGRAASSYDIRFATFSVADLAGDTTAWFNAAAAILGPPPPLAPGSQQTLLTSLDPGVTFYFALKSVDDAGLVSDVDDNAAAAQAVVGVPGIAGITNLTAVPGGADGEISLTWTAPARIGQLDPLAYEVRASSTSQIGDDAAFAAAEPLSVFSPSQPPAVGPPGLPEAFTVTGLTPAVTYYFALRAADSGGPAFKGRWLRDPPANAFNFARAPGAGDPAQPGTPTGLTAEAGLRRVLLAWSDLPDGPGGKGTDFAHYRLERSTTSGTDFVSVTTTTAASFLDRPLSAFTTFYYRVVARSQGGLESPPSAEASAAPFTLPPLEPLGLKVSPSGPTAAEISWSPTTRWSDGTAFDAPSSPGGDELTGYEILRATNVCGSLSLRGTVGVSVSSFTDATGGDSYFYVVRSSNAYFASGDSARVDLFGEHHYAVEDCVTRMVLDASQARLLDGETNAQGRDIMIRRRLRPEDTGGAVYQSVEFTPMIDGVEEMKDFHFESPAAFLLRFSTGPDGQPTPAAGESLLENMGVFWHNGQEFKKLYGKVDAVNQVVVAETPNPGVFQLRAMAREAGVTFDISNITSRIFTPNGDGRNDVVIFVYDNPRGAHVEGAIYDLRGAEVARMAPGPQPDSLMWDGRMNGAVVTSGVYVYQIKGEGKTFNGTIVVAR